MVNSPDDRKHAIDKFPEGGGDWSKAMAVMYAGERVESSLP